MPSSALAVSPFLTGDPIRLRGTVSSAAELIGAIELPGLESAGVRVLTPGVALVHSLTGNGDVVSLRCISLACPSGLIPGAQPIALALAIDGSIRQSGHALRLVGRLKACLRDEGVVAGLRAATTREELVTALRVVDASRGESPLSSAEVLALLGAGDRGLTAHEAMRRLAACGENRLERVRSRPITLRLVEQLTSFFAVLLWVASGFAYLAGMPELSVAVIVVILVNGIGSFLQEYRTERALRALEDLLPHTIGVLRDGEIADLATSAVVPGDVVRVEEGDQMPADGQVLASEGLRVDQSALTGESKPEFKLPALADAREAVPRFERHELMFAGTNVVAGTGHVVVTSSGMQTEIGEVARLTQSVGDEPSPLQREMARVTRIVTVLAVVFGAFFFLLAVATEALRPAEGFLFALGVIVANVPEGLLPTLTLALALGAQRMARLRSLIKRLSAVETLGATTVICTDKTGTLTEGRMAARSVWVSGQTVPADELSRDPRPDVLHLLEAAVLASQATREHGDPTEVALVVMAEQVGVDPESIRLEHPLVHVLPFDSFRKRMTMVRRDSGRTVAWVKGAPRETVALCTRMRWGAGTLPLDDDHQSLVLADHDRLAAEGLRILAVAERTVADDIAGAAVATVERDLTFLGLVALWDPPRPEVPEAIGLCQRAGIRVVMVTGDYGLTAQAIARRIGLRVETVVTGEEIERIGREALKRLVERPHVLFARTSPAHKLAIVEALHGDEEVVAVTGDGVNDAPALKAADIGVAMGQRGTEVAREAAEMVITDDNFASIVAAIRQGRAIYSNMGKFVSYIFASNVPELIPFLAFVLLGIPLPLTVMQILAVDLGTDLVPALALGAEPPEPGVMGRPPRSRTERLLGPRRLLHAYGFLGLIEATLAMAAFYWTYWIAG